MMQKTHISEDKNDSFKNAYILSEFAKALHDFGDDIEKSVGVFDSIGEKTEMFTKLEESIQKPMLDSMIEMQDISQNQIFKFVFQSFVEAFKNQKSNFNFIHFAATNERKLTFFLSTNDDKLKENLENLEYDYFTGKIHNYLDVNFCFLEPNMEKDLINTQKLEING